ncbi:hypothetical protein HMPREF9372_1304 [Sporosarcina newyorkensis 2681]|uniref:HlyD family secretion protein n=1 Tax=Sporosarcina newyorkensis 2681 TaxID=1027292 RepID=F9DR74_9BACL|nr:MULTISPECIES: hypothetical protein [Sporosarcina]EGQ26617.1 hypothetical protein HMPREF9372_1304 [Sporosarcina newyorkensis 2681]MBY0221100.1 hypothetical protein [Sporosarcina aquimarina]
MVKWRKIIAMILILSFIALNSYLVFFGKSDIPKSYYVNDYERLATGDYTKELDKEGFIAPKDLYTVYLKEDQTIDSWLVQEGESVDFGTELASLKTEYFDEQHNELNAERSALQNQVSTIRQTISDLEDEQERSDSMRNDNNSYDSLYEEKVQVNVDVAGSGAFAQAIADAERDLAQVQRQIETLDSKIDRLPTEAAMTSPVNGYVVKINREGAAPSIDIYSTDQTIVTYVRHDEWLDIEPGSFVTIQHEAIRTPYMIDEDSDSVSSIGGSDVAVAATEDPYDDLDHEVDGNSFDDQMDEYDVDSDEPVNGTDDPYIDNPDSDTNDDLQFEETPEGSSEQTPDEKKQVNDRKRIQGDYPEEVSTMSGTVVSVSKVPAQDDNWLKSYKALGGTQKENSQAYYEVRIAPYDEQLELPFATNVNIFIQTNEANQATSVKTGWLVNKTSDSAKVWTLDSKGRAIQTSVSTPFTSLDRSILTSGTESGMVALYNDNLNNNLDNQTVFHPLPLYLPEWDKWKGVHWKSYARYMIKH